MKVSLEKAFGEILRELRVHQRLTQEALAEKSELDRTFISMLERGERQPSLSSLFKLASALNTEVSRILKKLEERINENQ